MSFRVHSTNEATDPVPAPKPQDHKNQTLPSFNYGDVYPKLPSGPKPEPPKTRESFERGLTIRRSQEAQSEHY